MCVCVFNVVFLVEGIRNAAHSVVEAIEPDHPVILVRSLSKGLQPKSQYESNLLIVWLVLSRNPFGPKTCSSRGPFRVRTEKRGGVLWNSVNVPRRQLGLGDLWGKRLTGSQTLHGTTIYADQARGGLRGSMGRHILHSWSVWGW